MIFEIDRVGSVVIVVVVYVVEVLLVYGVVEIGVGVFFGVLVGFFVIVWFMSIEFVVDWLMVLVMCRRVCLLVGMLLMV